MPVAADRWPRIIVHADMDAFYAAIEQLDDPGLRGKPLLIGGRSNRSVVATASYEARPFGVGSAMPMALALRKCPDAIVVRPRFGRYVEMSRTVMEVFRDFAAKVEPLSLDEAFLDMSGAEGIFGSPAEMGRALKAAVFEATGGLNVSVGVSGTKFVAKVASDFDKPDGLTVVPPAQMVDFLAPLPVKRLWGAGPKTVPRLEALGLHTIGDVARADLGWLEAKLGSAGAHFGRLARADDPREVTPGREAKSIGWERTLETDIRTPAEITPHLRAAADEIARRLRKGELRARGVRVKLKTADFQIHTRQARLPTPAADAGPLYEGGVALLSHFELNAPLRLVGLTAYDLEEGDAPLQLDLFGQPAADRRGRLSAALDAVEARFGEGALRRSDGPDDDERAPPR